ncbi:SDR family oxidoreductase [Dyadobacter sandarakinus]|uniref:dTDP-4-dehydrorhamnose reductase n=1 Tax=Dyadobacter sandarakinus TaxID=2747268 RepID=A0ABX7IB81_9BACT|nr:NAD(P)-dependent oxidoreductase [Dyadobacter sandarakinus]QRR03379.1 NAD(P)-dependent oxidoreductase [Dyadobacter sandarakinus]
MKKQKILITGSNGLLGQKLVQLLAADPEVETIATASGTNRLPFQENYQFMEMDITDPFRVEEVIGHVRPDVVIHGAAMTNVDQCELEKEACWKANVKGTEHIVHACGRYGAFLLHVSTDFIFDGSAGPYAETDEPNPVNFYGWSKLAAEKAVMHAGISWAIARTVLVYGVAHDMSRSNIILWVKKSLEARKPIQVVTDQLRTPTLAEDLAIGCQLIARGKAEGIFHISGKDFLTPYEMAIMTADYFNLDKSLISPTDAGAFTQPARRPPRTGFELTRSREVLGYEPRTFREGIALLATQLNS